MFRQQANEGRAARSYDLAAWKQVDSPKNPELYLRSLAFFGVNLFLWLHVGLVFQFFWFCAYAAASGLHMAVVARAPVIAGAGWRALVLATGTLVAGVFVCCMVHFWSQPQAELKLLAVFGLMGMMLNTVAFRAHDTLMAGSEAAMVGAGLVGVSIWTLVQPGLAVDGWFMLTVSLLIFAYFLFSLVSHWRALRALAEAEMRRLKAARSDAIGQLSGGLAHDFNNLLTVILGNLELHDIVEDGQERADLRRAAMQAAARAAEMTDELLSYSGRSILRPEVIDLAPVVRALSRDVDALLAPDQTFSWDAGHGLPEVLADRAHLRRVLRHLVDNALAATSGGGRIALTVRAGHTHAAIEVTDNGPGIPAAQRERAVEPFFTTCGSRKGLGLGLALAHGFAVQSGGRLVLGDAAGGGTRVRLDLPLARSMGQPHPTTSAVA